MPRRGDLAVVVAAHGRDELQALRAALEAGVPYVGLVASRRRGTGVLGELRSTASPTSCWGGSTFRPASTSAPARRPRSRCRSWPGSSRCAAAVRLDLPVAPRPQAVDPICGMTVAVTDGTPTTRSADGSPIYFCCEGCKTRFEAQVA